MSKKLFVALAVIFVFTLPAFAESNADPCEQQQLKIQALEREREQMLQEIQRLETEVRQLNQTLDNIRSQVGSGEPAPTTYGLPRAE